MNKNNTPRKANTLLQLTALGCAAAMLSSSASAAFHLWTIRELFTNLDGSQQFIELFTTSSSQTVLSGQQIQVTDQAGTTTHTFTIPANVSGNTANRAYLLATSAFAAAPGAVTPDAIVPSGFLFPAGGTINFFGTPASNVYTALPTNGVLSRAYPGTTNQTNSPQNYAGASGQVVPEPATFALFGLGGVGLCALLRRRSA